MRFPIRIKLVAVYLIIILAIMVLTFYSLQTTKEIYIDEIGRNSLLVGEEMFKRMNQRVFHLIGQFQAALNARRAQEFLVLSNENYDSNPEVNNFIRKNDEEWIHADEDEITPFMAETIENEQARYLREVFLEGYEKVYGLELIQEIIVTNKYGANVAASGKTSDFYQGDEAWWKEAMEKGIHVGKVEYDESIGKWGIDIGIKINDHKGNFLGVLLFNLNAKAVIREAEVGTRKYQSTQIQIVTSDGRLIFSSRPYRFMEYVRESLFYKNTMQSEHYIISHGDQPTIFSFTPSGGYKFFQGFGWTLIISHHLDEVLEPYYSIQKRIIVVLFLVLFFSTSLLFILEKRITSPINALVNAARKIGKGQLSERVMIKSNDEFRDLASTFNLMVDKRQQVEEDLKDSEGRFRAIFEQAAVGVAQIEIKTGKFVRINKKFCNIVGYSVDEMMQLTFMRITHPEDLQEDLNNLKRLIAGKIKEYSIENRYFHKDGSVVWANITVSPMWKTDEEREHCIVILEDITDRKRTEENLHFTQFAVDRASDFAFWFNPDGSFSYVNDSACRWIGYERKELLGMSVLDITPYLSPERWAEHWKELKERKAFIFETTFQTADGRYLPVEIAVNYTEFRGKEYNCAFVRDITDRKIAEEEKIRIEKQLRQAQKMEAIGTLAGGIAHDFNNILSVILGYADIAKADISADSKLTENLDEIIQAGLRAKDLVKQILAFSRQAEVDRIQIQPSTILKESIKLIRSSMPATIEIHENVDPETGIIFADPTQIHQVIMNLFTNAFHAMEQSGGRLEIVLREVTLERDDFGNEPGVEPGEFIRLTVSDNGTGIAPEIRDNIFAQFFDIFKI